MDQLFWTFDYNVECLTKIDQTWPNLTKIDQNFWVPFFDRFDANVAITNTFYFTTFLISCLKVSQTDKNEMSYHALLTMVFSPCSHQKCGIHLTFLFCLIRTPFWILAFDQFWTINFEFLNFDHQKLGFAPCTGGFSKSDIERPFHTLVHAAIAMTYRIATKNDTKVGVRPWCARCYFEMCRTIEPFWKKPPFTWCQRFSSDENHQVAK